MAKLKVYEITYSSKTPVHNVLVGQIITRNITRSDNNRILFNCLTDMIGF